MKDINSFELMNGTILTGEPRVGAPVEWSNKWVQEAEWELFVKNAHFLLANKEHIFADSKLFLTPVRVRSGLAYVGNFSMPCLGGFLEWWLNSEYATKGEGDEKELVFCVSGSPLSGHNVSLGVRKDGSTRYCAPGMVLRMAQSYCEVMRRYREIMKRLESYSLSETLAILKLGIHMSDSTLNRTVDK